MIKVRAAIQKWGNNLTIRKSDSFVPKKRKFLPFTEAQLLKGLTPKKAHADEIFTC